MKKLVILAALLAASSAGAVDIAPPISPSVYESLGPIQCSSIEDVTARHNPADILHGASDCIHKNDFDRAAGLYLMASAYGRYDTLRVASESAVETLWMLIHQMQEDLTDAQRKGFQAAFDQAQDGIIDKAKICASIESVGKPSYYPRYMIRHGVNDSNRADGMVSPLVNGFDSSAAWVTAMGDYIKCPVTSNFISLTDISAQ